MLVTLVHSNTRGIHSKHWKEYQTAKEQKFKQKQQENWFGNGYSKTSILEEYNWNVTWTLLPINKEGLFGDTIVKSSLDYNDSKITNFKILMVKKRSRSKKRI